MSSGDLYIRDARDGEWPLIRELTLRAYAEYAQVMAETAWAGLRGAVQSTLSGDGPPEAVQAIVAEQDGRLVGSMLLFPPAADAYGGKVEQAPWPEVRLLAVAPEARGQGIGKALMEECIRRAQAMGASQLGLHTSESLRVAVRLYERMGFLRTPRYDFQPEGAELVRAYALPLAEPVLFPDPRPLDGSERAVSE